MRALQAEDKKVVRVNFLQEALHGHYGRAVVLAERLKEHQEQARQVTAAGGLGLCLTTARTASSLGGTEG